MSRCEDAVLASLYDPLALAAPCRDRCLMASSYDRRGGNHDWSNYLRVEGNEAVLMDADGPGVIVRIWTADPQHGLLRIYLDDAREPTIVAPFDRLFEQLPLSFGIGGESPENYARSAAEGLAMGRTSYCPIPFRQRCRITIEPEDDYLYYQVNWRRLPPDSSVETFVPNAAPSPHAAAAAELWSRWDQGADLDAFRTEEQTLELAAGETRTFFSAAGAGAIRRLTVQMPAQADPRVAQHLAENLWLIGSFDDDETRDPSVRAPIGPFFLDYGHARKARSFLLGDRGDGVWYCRFAMPHTQRATFQLVNRSIVPTGPIVIGIAHEAWDAPRPELFRFRATWHEETPFGPDHRDYGGAACRILNLDGRDNYEFLNVRGAGRFVGCGFHVDLRDAPTDRAAGEGDEMFFIDDDPSLTLYGTGAEDYVNDAWGIRGYSGPLSGDDLEGEWGRDPRFFGYRLHLSDSAPFYRKGRFTLEHGTGNNCSGRYRSVAYWYMDPASMRTRIEERRWEEIRNGVRPPTSPIT